MKIAPEGKPLIVAMAAAAFLLRRWNRTLGLLGGAAALFVAWFFRDPERDVVVDPAKVTSPADGKIVSVEEVDEPEFIGGRAVKIAIFMSVTDVHINRVPAAGKVALARHVPGRFLPAFHENASFENERHLLGVETAHGRMLVKQVAGVVARRIVCRPREGDELAQGARFGMIKFSSRCEVFLEKRDDLRVNVNIMDTVRGGLTVLAEYAG